MGLELQGEQGCNGATLVGVQRPRGYPCTPEIWNFILGREWEAILVTRIRKLTEKGNSQWDDGGKSQRVPWPLLFFVGSSSLLVNLVGHQRKDPSLNRQGFAVVAQALCGGGWLDCVPARSSQKNWSSEFGQGSLTRSRKRAENSLGKEESKLGAASERDPGEPKHRGHLQTLPRDHRLNSGKQERAEGVEKSWGTSGRDRWRCVAAMIPGSPGKHLWGFH